MQIPVNTNIDKYKDDFFKGFSAKETGYAAVILLIYLICYVVLTALFYIPQTLAMYLSLPLPLLAGMVGMMKLTGHDMAGNLLKRYQIRKMPVYLYQPSALNNEKDLYYPYEKKERQSSKKQKEQQVYLQTEGDSKT